MISGTETIMVGASAFTSANNYQISGGTATGTITAPAQSSYQFNGDATAHIPVYLRGTATHLTIDSIDFTVKYTLPSNLFTVPTQTYALARIKTGDTIVISKAIGTTEQTYSFSGEEIGTYDVEQIVNGNVDFEVAVQVAGGNTAQVAVTDQTSITLVNVSMQITYSFTVPLLGDTVFIGG